MGIHVVAADYTNPTHAQHVVSITDAYARDLMGGGKPLDAQVKATMVAGLAATPGALGFIAFQDDAPVGLATCFSAYSTFAAKPLINVHDLAVLPQARGQGVGAALLRAVDAKARELGCCKVTLEVLETNPARRLYEREGFTLGEPKYYFMAKVLA